MEAKDTVPIPSRRLSPFPQAIKLGIEALKRMFQSPFEDLFLSH